MQLATTLLAGTHKQLPTSWAQNAALEIETNILQLLTSTAASQLTHTKSVCTNALETVP